MPRKDVYHEIVKQALIDDGWTITHDPYPLQFGEESLYVDLGAEMPIGAEKAGLKIAVEIKSFLSPSPVTELERTLGQFTLYRFFMQRQEADRMLYVAVSDVVYDLVFDIADVRDLVAAVQMRLLLFDAESARIVRWIE
jgi:XisH protein